MQTTILFILFSICFLCCSTNKEIMCERQAGKCTQVEAESISDCILKKSGYKIETLKKKITETDTFFLIQYMPLDTLIRGGGAEIKVSKEKCKVIEVKRYQ